MNICHKNWADLYKGSTPFHHLFRGFLLVSNIPILILILWFSQNASHWFNLKAGHVYWAAGITLALVVLLNIGKHMEDDGTRSFLTPISCYAVFGALTLLNPIWSSVLAKVVLIGIPSLICIMETSAWHREFAIGIIFYHTRDERVFKYHHEDYPICLIFLSLITVGGYAYYLLSR